MMSERPFSQELWDQTPTAVQDYIRALEARVTALEATSSVGGDGPGLDGAAAAGLAHVVAAPVERSARGP